MASMIRIIKTTFLKGSNDVDVYLNVLQIKTDYCIIVL